MTQGQNLSSLLWRILTINLQSTTWYRFGTLFTSDSSVCCIQKIGDLTTNWCDTAWFYTKSKCWHLHYLILFPPFSADDCLMKKKKQGCSLGAGLAFCNNAQSQKKDVNRKYTAFLFRLSSRPFKRNRQRLHGINGWGWGGSPDSLFSPEHPSTPSPTFSVTRH